MKKKILVLLGITLLLTSCGEAPKLKNGEDAVLSFKDDKKVSVNTLYEDMKDTYALSTLIDLMDRHVLEDKYKDNVKQAKEDAIAEVVRVKEMFGYESGNYNEEVFNSYLRQVYGVNTIEALESSSYLNALRDLAAEDYLKPKVTTKEINAYYEKEIVGDIEASHILIKSDVKDTMNSTEKKEAEAKALNEAKDLIAKLEKAKDLKKEFATLAKENSDDPGSKEDGGKLDWFNKGTMVIEFEKAAYALKVGEISKEPVKTEHGYHIILKTGEKDKPKLDEVKDEVIDAIVEQKLKDKSIHRVDAMIDIRKKYDMIINDEELKEQYGQYMNYLINTANENDAKK